MKLNCGLTKEEIKQATILSFLNREVKYKFAWLPVRVGTRDCRWLERIRLVPTAINYISPMYDSRESLTLAKLDYYSEQKLMSPSDYWDKIKKEAIEKVCRGYGIEIVYKKEAIK